MLMSSLMRRLGLKRSRKKNYFLIKYDSIKHIIPMPKTIMLFSIIKSNNAKTIPKIIKFKPIFFNKLLIKRFIIQI